MQNKRGISTIVVTLIMVLLSIVAVGIVWAVIANILDTGTEQTTSGFGQLFLNLKIEKVVVEDSGDVSVTVKRNKGEGELSGINFIVSDGTNSQVIKQDTTLQELGSNTFTIQKDDLTTVGFVKEISVAPITTASGKEVIGDAVDSEILTNKQVLENLGAVSWWKLDGNAQDEIGGNDGTLEGGVTFVDGKFGKAANLDSSGDYVSLSSQPDLTNGFTFFTIVRRQTDAASTIFSNNQYFIRTEPEAEDNGQNFFESFVTIGTESTSEPRVSSMVPATIGQWFYVASTWDKSKLKIYVDGEFKAESLGNSRAGSLTATVGGPIFGNSVNGQIDEVMIFNKALTDNQIKAIYGMDLS